MNNIRACRAEDERRTIREQDVELHFKHILRTISEASPFLNQYIPSLRKTVLFRRLTCIIVSPVRDPYLYRPFGTGQVLEFSDYGQGPFSRADFMDVVNLAMAKALRNPGNRSIDREVLIQGKRLQLTIFAGPDMTWRMFGSAVWGSMMFVKRFGMFYEWKISIVLGEKVIGTGQLVEWSVGDGRERGIYDDD
ncbi:MAG: hypothetical protein Q9219_004626 [cf. Caloplaca sp. 3 TL-2023]